MTHRGPITRTVADAALALDVMAYQEQGDPFSVRTHPRSFLDGLDGGIRGLRVAWSADLGFAVVEPEVAAAVERAAQAFERLGCDVEEASPGFPNQSPTFMRIAAPFDAAWIGALSEEQRALMDDPARFFYATGKSMTAVDVAKGNLDRMELWHTMQRFHQRYDLLLTPVTACTAFLIGQEPTRIAGRDIPPAGWMPFTQPFNLTGQPAASVPCGFDGNGLPIGLHIVGRAYEDALVLRAARAYEAAEIGALPRPGNLEAARAAGR
jgi:aspartyl-tRNA(Asn)/glutamyl-tRNA(Gln) amidotransferase subunit A